MENNIHPLATPKLADVPAVHEVYSSSFFKRRDALSWRVPIVCRALIDTFSLSKLSCVLDVGCAIGEYVNHFNRIGRPATGIEGSFHVLPYALTDQLIIHDLRLPFRDANIPSGFSLAYSLEVAEHIEPQYASVYMDNLCYASPVILMTAAPPGQGGHGHVNCQPKGWWTAEMQNRNYRRNYNLEEAFSQNILVQTNRREVVVYAKNVMVFESIRFTGRI